MIPARESWLLQLPESVRAAVVKALEATTWTTIKRALSAFDVCLPEQQGPQATIHVLSSFNLETIEPALRLGLKCIPCRPELVIAPLDTIEQQLLNQDSMVYHKRSLATLILWRAEEVLPDLFFPVSGLTKEPARRSEEFQHRVTSLVRTYLEFAASPLFVATLPVPIACGSVVLGSQLDGGMVKTIAEINAAIVALRQLDSRVRVIDLNSWAAKEGACHYDLQMDFLARQPMTIRSAASLGFFIARNIRPLLVPRRKVLAVDVDNTLWGGVVAEDGVRGLKLGRDFPGNVFWRLQREIRELKHQGILLMLASKNEEAEVRQAMANLPDMVLRWEDFVCRKINFNPKYLNLREAAQELGLGLDSFAFLDDSDFERAQMNSFNPEVLVLNQRGDPLYMLASLFDADAFDVHHITDEDRQRHREYELRSARSVHRQDKIEEFLSSLELSARLEPVHDSNIGRVVQMLGKTNQFNLTTRRHQTEDLKRLLSRPGTISLTLRLADKFGDQGIVGFLLAIAGPDDGCLSVDSFLVSCRALGRGVEDLLWAELVNRAASIGVIRIHAEYIPTPKNGLVTQFYDRLGLTRIAGSELSTRYVLEAVTPMVGPAWMTVERVDHEQTRFFAQAVG